GTRLAPLPCMKKGKTADKRPTKDPHEEALQRPPARETVVLHDNAAREVEEEARQYTQSSPRLTGGDVDADWRRADSVGEEAPGGTVATPDQNVVDDIGDALGV